MTGGAFLRMQKLTGRSIVSVAAKHNHREILAEMGGTPGSAIDPSRTPTNYVLRGAGSAAGVAKAAQELMDASGITALRKDAVRAIEIVFSLPPSSPVNQRAFFDDAARWAETTLGAPVISAIVHNDEAAPHAHIIVLPLVGGRMVGSGLMGNRAKLQALQADFQMMVGQRYGLARQPAPARLSATLQREVMDLAFASLEANSGLQSGLLRVLLEPHRGNPAPLLLALGITMPAPKPKAKDSFVAIMTRPCKQERKPKGFARPKPIGFDVLAPAENEQTLCSVGFADSTPPIPADFHHWHATTVEQTDDQQLLINGTRSSQPASTKQVPGKTDRYSTDIPAQHFAEDSAQCDGPALNGAVMTAAQVDHQPAAAYGVAPTSCGLDTAVMGITIAHAAEGQNYHAGQPSTNGGRCHAAPAAGQRPDAGSEDLRVNFGNLQISATAGHTADVSKSARISLAPSEAGSTATDLTPPCHADGEVFPQLWNTATEKDALTFERILRAVKFSGPQAQEFCVTGEKLCEALVQQHRCNVQGDSSVTVERVDAHYRRGATARTSNLLTFEQEPSAVDEKPKIFPATGLHQVDHTGTSIAGGDYQRHRDTDQPVECWDADLGEFIKPTTKDPTRPQPFTAARAPAHHLKPYRPATGQKARP